VLLPDNQKEPYQAATKELFMASDGMILAQRLDEIVRMRMLLHPKDWKAESVLMMNRWFDYRFTSPLSLTLQFGEIYREKLRAHIRRHEDVGKAETVSGTREGLPNEPAKWFTILWKARQRADEFFLPYDEYIEFCFDFSSRRKRYWTMLPSQLHPSLKNREAWLQSFDRFYADRITALVKNAGEIPHYRLENDLGLPAQVQFREIMLSEMSFSSRRMADQIAERVCAKRHLDLASALGRVAPDDREEVSNRAQSSLSHGDWPEAPLVKLTPSQQLPSCFGITESFNAEGSHCSNCPLVDKCSVFGRKAMDITARLTGYSSPLWEADKRRVADNVANWRARKLSAQEHLGAPEAGVS
jgi:hypothetical protein